METSPFSFYAIAGDFLLALCLRILAIYSYILALDTTGIGPRATLIQGRTIIRPEPLKLTGL
jgi:hypothetical protein